MAVQSDDLEALKPPEVNVSLSGIVPFKLSGNCFKNLAIEILLCPSKFNIMPIFSVFQVSLECTGRKTAEVGVTINLNVTVPSANNITVLNLKRTKVCLRSKYYHLTQNYSVYQLFFSVILKHEFGTEAKLAVLNFISLLHFHQRGCLMGALLEDSLFNPH